MALPAPSAARGAHRRTVSGGSEVREEHRTKRKQEPEQERTCVMPEYLSPGVYVQEVDSGPKPIEGVGTATAAFVGFAAGGPVNRPTLVTNWTQYVETFGSIEDGGRRNAYLPGAYLAHAVYGYFQNG